MSQELQDLQKGFESKLNEFYNNELKEYYPEFTGYFIKFISAEMRFLEEHEPMLKQIKHKMCNENSNECSLESYVNGVEFNTFDYNDTNKIIKEMMHLRDNFFDNIDHSIESHTNGIESNTFDYNNETSTEIMHSIL